MTYPVTRIPLPHPASGRNPHPASVLAALILLSGVASAQPSARKDVRFCAGGDVSLGTNLDTTWSVNRFDGNTRVRALPDPRELLAPLSPLVSDAGLLLLNVEGAIGDGPAPRKCARGSTLCYALRQQPDVAATLRHVNDSGVVVGNVANNHAHDAGAAGLLETRRWLAQAGVLAAGADTLATPVPVGDGDTVAVLGFSPWSIAGVTDLDAVRRHVTRAAERYGRVIVTMHIGAEGATARHAGPGRALRRREPGQQRRLRAGSGRGRRKPRDRKRTPRAARHRVERALAHRTLARQPGHVRAVQSLGLQRPRRAPVRDTGARRLSPRRRAALDDAARSRLCAGGPRESRGP